MTALRLRRGALAALTVAVLAACSAIPTSGPVQEGNAEVAEPTDIDVLAEGPQPGDTPTEIVDGFLAAGAAGFSDGFNTAREYLAGEAKASWKPDAGVAVAGPLEYQPSTVETEVTIDVPVKARVDEGGRYAEAAPEGSESVTFDMVQDDHDQWRIAALPDGLILQQEDFARSFRPASLFFLSPDQKYLVPESRWFPSKNLPTSIMTELLAGPSTWLQDAVDTAVPDGVELNPQSVIVDDDGVAHVSLAPALPVTRADRDLLLAQIDASLLPVKGIGSVQVDAGGVLLEAGGTKTLQGGNPPPSNVEFLQDDAIVALADNEVTPVPGLDTLAGLDPRSPARSEDATIRVVLYGASVLSTVPTAAAPARTLLTGSGLVAPSVDRFGWVWTAESPGGLVAVPTDGDPVHVAAPWLDGRTVRAVRVARDGVRIAIVSAGSDGVNIDVAAITRDESGAPQQVGVPVRAGASVVDASSVSWSDESTLAVVGRSTGNQAVHLVPVAGPTRALPEVAKLAAMAGGSVIYVTTTDGELRKFVGSTWAQVLGVKGASYPFFPG
ncbi:LpqB family beta-propeller domain-containing protein [Cellulomonas sp. ICMP 17802]|uniref:LpqB family beta-propeller domain-containing protein n=1 Tax=Cellulomonas sp. ICMP 17802 TaxID=3239199 RepID=UPI00351B3732